MAAVAAAGVVLLAAVGCNLTVVPADAEMGRALTAGAVGQKKPATSAAVVPDMVHAAAGTLEVR